MKILNEIYYEVFKRLIQFNLLRYTRAFNMQVHNFIRGVNF